jgi:glycine hydroxymethyltransferase
MKEAEMKRIATFIDRVLTAPEDEKVLAAVKNEVKSLASDFPLYPATEAAPH